MEKERKPPRQQPTQHGGRGRQPDGAGAGRAGSLHTVLGCKILPADLTATRAIGFQAFRKRLVANEFLCGNE
jgi:hypothetical protein